MNDHVKVIVVLMGMDFPLTFGMVLHLVTPMISLENRLHHCHKLIYLTHGKPILIGLGEGLLGGGGGL